MADHFSHLDYLKILFSQDYIKLKSQVKFNIIGCILLLIVFLVTLVATFTFLEFKSLSLIPLFSLFVISLSIVLLIINFIRFTVINKLIKGEYKIDHKFLKLLLIKLILDFEDYNTEYLGLQFYSNIKEEKLIKQKSNSFSPRFDESLTNCDDTLKSDQVNS